MNRSTLLDWNVFFSTISQTSGAIVGIFAAFLITKIVSNQAEFSQDKADASNFILKSEALCDEAKSRYFKWYNERIRDKELCDIDEAFHEKGELLTSAEYLDKYNFSSFDAKGDIVPLLEEKVAEFHSIRAKEQAERDHFENNIFGIAYAMPKLMYTKPLSVVSIDTTPEREEIDNLLVRTIHQVKVNKSHVEKLSSGQDSSNLINFSIISVLLLFFAGVICPLSFLPLKVNTEINLSIGAFWDILFSLKGAMLSLISVIFSGLMLVFLKANMKLKHTDDTIEKLAKFSQLENYSDYYKNYIDNTGTNGQEFI